MCALPERDRPTTSVPRDIYKEKEKKRAVCFCFFPTLPYDSEKKDELAWRTSRTWLMTRTNSRGSCIESRLLLASRIAADRYDGQSLITITKWGQPMKQFMDEANAVSYNLCWLITMATLYILHHNANQYFLKVINEFNHVVTCQLIL